jgi:hypothetical protein
VGRSLWREDGSVVYQTQSAVIRLLSVCTTYMLQVIKCMYIQHIQGLCQSRLSTADHALSLVASATTAVQSLERSHARPPPSSSLPHFPCRGSPCPMSRTFSPSRFRMTSACFLPVTNELPFIAAREPNRDRRLPGFPYCSSWMRCLGNRVSIPKQRSGFQVFTIFCFRTHGNRVP